MEQDGQVLKKSKQVILASSVNEGSVTSEHLKVVDAHIDLSPILINADRSVIAVRILWVSVDPYLRLRMKNVEESWFESLLRLRMKNVEGSCFEPFKLNQPIVTRCVSRVIASANADYKVGDIVAGFSDLSEYALIPATSLQKIEATDFVSIEDYLHVLGSSGLTAWAGLIKIADPKPGEQVFVSAAAGAVGIIVGQLAKIKGCRVVGCTSSDEKARILKEELGFDEAFNYKKEADWDAALTRCFPNGIDIYFENVGGCMLEAVLNHINVNARIPVCGMISQYNEDWHKSYGVKNLIQLIGSSAKMQGFSVRSYMNQNQMAAYQEEMIGYMKQGKVKYKTYVKHGIDNFLDAFNTMFSGENVGKVLVHLSDETF